ncbi:MAG: LacI family DNA-binding transcriptional regulator [Planctomycetota bacterium]
MAKRVTVYEIASACGVSQPTVSRILGRGPAAERHSAETRRLVLETAKRLGYRPNAAARAMGRNRFGAIGLLLSKREHASTLPPLFLDSVLDVCNERDLNLSLLRSDDATLTDSKRVPRLLRESSTDGLLIDYTHAIPPRLLEIVDRHRIPAIWLNSKQPADCIRPDDEQGGYDAARLLIERGHTKIAYLDMSHGPDADYRHYSADDRRVGYERALAEARLKPNIVQAESGETVPSAERVAFCRRLLEQVDRPTGVVCYGHVNHLVAAALLVGLTVPEDLSVVTFADAPTNAISIEGVSGFLLPQREIGSAAVTMLLEKIADPSASVSPLVMPMTPFAGTTLAAPAAG